MNFNLKYITFILLFIVFSCKSPLEIDTDRLEDIDIRNINVLDLSQDTIDFGIIEKNAFKKHLFSIKNIDDKPVEILNMKLKKQPSYFYFDPTQKLTNLMLYNNPNNNSLNLYLNVKQSNVAEFEDVVLIETVDTTFEIVAKSIVPDIRVEDLGEKNQLIGEKKYYKIKVFNYSNSNRYIDSIYIDNSNDLEIEVHYDFYNKFFKSKTLYPDSNYEFLISIIANKQGVYNPKFNCNVKELFSGEKLILKNSCDLILNVE